MYLTPLTAFRYCQTHSQANVRKTKVDDLPYLLWGLFLANTLLYRYIGRSVISQPSWNHPPIFYAWRMKMAAVIVPFLIYIALVVASFFFTNWGVSMLCAVLIACLVFATRPSYDEEYTKLFSYLTDEWDMKPEYASSFLGAYKKELGKLFHMGNKGAKTLGKSSDPEVSLFVIAHLDDDEVCRWTITVQAYVAYMRDLRRGKQVGTLTEKTIWAILVGNPDIVEIKTASL